MLKELKISGFKLLKDIKIEPHSGFNVITGETGAGKSLVLGALKYLLGEKGGDEMFAKGEDTVKISATFHIPPSSSIKEQLQRDNLIEPDEDEIHIERWKQRDGRSKLFLGGRRANLSAVRQIQELLIDFLGQGQASRLTERPALAILDSIGDDKHQKLYSTFSEAHKKWTSLENEINLRKEKIRKLSERRDLMEFQLKELNETNLIKGELDQLNHEMKLLSSSTELRENISQAMELMTDEETSGTSAQDLLSRAIELIRPLAEIEKDWDSRLKELNNAESLIREIARELSSRMDSIQDDPKRLNHVDQRISLLEKLKRKYDCDIDDLISLREKLSSDIDLIQSGDDDLSKLQDQLSDEMKNLILQAEKLTKSRQKLAKQIEKKLIKHLADLDLPNARVQFKFEKRTAKNPSQTGNDIVSLLLSTNLAENLQPMNIVASGGEATRITLALKALWAEREGVPILVLDEADVGIGGDTAYKVGEKFRELSKSHQLIIVSHLTQVAFLADRHFLATKTESKKSTGIQISALDENDKISELARMMGGSRDIKSSVSMVKSLLETKTGKGRVAQVR